MALKPWDDWYHVMGNTYGTWVRGDPRGWRSRHHREHVEGDYKSPPPEGAYDEEYRRSMAGMKGRPVVFTIEQRGLACRWMGEALLFYKAEVEGLCMGAKHFHLLARFVECGVERPPAPADGNPRPGGRGRSKVIHAFDVDPKPRLVVGKAKSWVTKQMKRAGHFADHAGGLWGKRPQVLPVECGDHFDYLRTRYIPEHRGEGAAVWGELDR